MNAGALNETSTAESALRVGPLGVLGMAAMIAIGACGNGNTASSGATSSSAASESGMPHLYFRPVICIAPPYMPPVGAQSQVPNGPPSPCSTQAQAGLPTPLDTALARVPSTPPVQDDPRAVVLLPQNDASGTVVRRYELGPAVLDGKAIQSANAALPQNGGGWQVNFTLTTSGSFGLDALGRNYYQRQVAIELNGEVLSAPTIQAQSFGGRGQIAGDFTESRARSLVDQVLKAR